MWDKTGGGLQDNRENWFPSLRTLSPVLLEVKEEKGCGLAQRLYLPLLGALRRGVGSDTGTPLNWDTHEPRGQP